MADDDRPKGQQPPPPPEPPKEAPVATTTAPAPAGAATEIENLNAPKEGEEVNLEDVVLFGGPVTDTKLSVAEAEAAVEDAEMRFFHGTRQGTEAHVNAERKLEEARANLRLARQMRRYGHGRDDVAAPAEEAAPEAYAKETAKG